MSPPSRSITLGVCCVALLCVVRVAWADDENGRPDGGGPDGGGNPPIPDGGDGDGRNGGGPDGGGNPPIPDGGDGDGRPPGFDAGPIPGNGDAGVDAGTGADAGPDAGTGTDSGAPSADGGGDGGDGGDIENPPVGCGCASAGALNWVAFLTALALARRWRANPGT